MKHLVFLTISISLILRAKSKNFVEETETLPPLFTVTEACADGVGGAGAGVGAGAKVI